MTSANSAPSGRCAPSDVLRYCGLGAILLACVSVLAGCGRSASSGDADVSGKVTVKGAPAAGATITFIGADNQRGNSAVGDDGSYKINKAPLGAVKVTVTTPPVGNPGPGMPEVKKAAVPVPLKYATPEGGLTYTVTKGSQTKDFALDP